MLSLARLPALALLALAGLASAAPLPAGLAAERRFDLVKGVVRPGHGYVPTATVVLDSAPTKVRPTFTHSPLVLPELLTPSSVLRLAAALERGLLSPSQLAQHHQPSRRRRGLARQAADALPVRQPSRGRRRGAAAGVRQAPGGRGGRGGPARWPRGCLRLGDRRSSGRPSVEASSSFSASSTPEEIWIVRTHDAEQSLVSTSSPTYPSTPAKTSRRGRSREPTVVHRPPLLPFPSDIWLEAATHLSRTSNGTPSPRNRGQRGRGKVAHSHRDVLTSSSLTRRETRRGREKEGRRGSERRVAQ